MEEDVAQSMISGELDNWRSGEGSCLVAVGMERLIVVCKLVEEADILGFHIVEDQLEAHTDY